MQIFKTENKHWNIRATVLKSRDAVFLVVAEQIKPTEHAQIKPAEHFLTERDALLHALTIVGK